MAAPATRCPVHAEFDPLGEEYLRDPFALMDDLPLPLIPRPPEEALHRAQQMVAYRRYPRELVATKATERADDFAGALLEIQVPEHWARLVTEPELIPGAVDEIRGPQTLWVEA